MIPIKKIPKEYRCESCHYVTCNKKDYNKHLETDKHKLKVNPANPYTENKKKYECYCGKAYKHHSSLCFHQKHCVNKSSNFVLDKEFAIMIIKQNQEVLKQNAELKTNMLELMKKVT